MLQLALEAWSRSEKASAFTWLLVFVLQAVHGASTRRLHVLVSDGSEQEMAAIDQAATVQTHRRPDHAAPGPVEIRPAQKVVERTARVNVLLGVGEESDGEAARAATEEPPEQLQLTEQLQPTEQPMGKLMV